MDGCEAGLTCHEGSCLTQSQIEKKDNTQYPYCAKDANCPTWQACIQGRCYSTCRSSSECANGYTCHAYVCRKQCNVRTSPCDNQSTCKTKSSDDGVCMPKPTLNNSNQNTTSNPPGTFTVSYPSLPFSKEESSRQLFITNKSKFATNFTLSRLNDTIASNRPLSWLKLDRCKTYSADGKSCEAFEEKPSAIEPFVIKNVEPNKTVIVKVSNAADKPKDKNTYQGTLQVKADQLDTKEVNLNYRETTDGQWKGTMVSFGNFRDDNIENIRSSAVDIRNIKNALLRQWINYKKNGISRDQFVAVLRSIKEGTWQQTKVADDCRKLFSTQNSADVVCFPYSSKLGYEVLSFSQREAPVPTGASELNFTINVKENGTALEGRIDSTQTLQYPGNPAIRLEFAQGISTQPKAFLSKMEAVIDIGGRFHVDKDATCADPNFEKVTIPWMVPGFAMMSYEQPDSLFRTRHACRSKTVGQTIPSNATDVQKAAIEAYNKSLSASNPVPNGWQLQRKLELVDGALIEGQYMFILYKESFVSFFNNGGKGTLNNNFVNYGYMFLRRVNTTLEADDYVGAKAVSLQSCERDTQCPGQVCRGGICRQPSKLQVVSCSPDIVYAAVGQRIAQHTDLQSWSADKLNDLVTALMGNQTASANSTSMQVTRQTNQGKIEYRYTHPDGTQHYIHYLCMDTGQFNGGTIDDPKDCPVGSKVIFFESTIDEDTMRSHSCQTKNSCALRYSELYNTKGFRSEVPYRCESQNSIFCENNRKDLRDGKVFFKPSTSNTFVSTLSPLRSALFEAFRYRIKFRSRSGKNVGFTPEMCSQVASSQTPYCYNPQVIEQLEQRVNCLEAIFAQKDSFKNLTTVSQSLIKNFLTQAFSYSNQTINGNIITDYGFETLNAELKVMLGDEAFTRSFASRYNLANTSLVSFQGALLEPNGINLSGALGYEMYNLYLSTQYYQMVLDRFFSMANVIHQSFASTGSSFIEANSVTSYFQKLLLASTRKSRSWSQIAKRYHQLNRADLAKHVIERAYAATYMEMTLLTRLLRELTKVLDAKELNQISIEIAKVALTYKSSLLDMEETYKKLGDSLNRFGFEPGYIPFPAMDSFAALSGTSNAFQVALRFAKEKTYDAQSKEQIAINTTRSFDSDAARFQSELVHIEKNYETQLISICGAIEITDTNGQTRTVPAIPKYASLSPRTKNVGDPCGLVPGGSLYNALIQLEKQRINQQALKQSQTNILEKIQMEERRIKKYCDDQFKLTDIAWQYKDKDKNLQLEIFDLNQHVQRASRIGSALIQVAELVKCSTIVGADIQGGDCASAPAAIGIILGMTAITEGISAWAGLKMREKQAEMLEIQKKLQTTQLQFSCRACSVSDPLCKKEGTAQQESKISIKEYTYALANLNFESLKAEYDLQMAISHISRLRQQARRLMTQLEETTQLTINVQAAQNDPNTRIYKNDAILSAERTFNEAMKEAYRTTLVYEYYTSQSYKFKGDLFLIRMVSSGDKNLEAYLSQLEQAFREFEEKNGKPSARVLVLSLRDDILRIPRTNENKTPRDLNDRVAEFQRLLSDRNRLNENGYTSIPFTLDVSLLQSAVSPVTYNHKIVHIEAEINSTSKGDDVARLYLRQKGTGMVRLANDEVKYYALPQNTAVINPFFNGSKVFPPEIYRNFRLRDRPLGNTQWELLFNQVSEKANQDINLNAVSDIVLYIYYTDFTKEN